MTSSTEVWPNDSGFDTNYEVHEPIDLVVKGTLPPYVSGVLYRTGPLGYKANTKDGKVWAANHWFDGFSCVHRFQIDFPDQSSSAKVQYRSRRTVDEMLVNIRDNGKLDGFTFGAKRDPCESIFKKVMGLFVSDRTPPNVGVTLSVNMPGGNTVGAGEKPLVDGHTNGVQTLHAKTDASTLLKIDPETLESQDVTNQKRLHPDLVGEFSAAHAKSDPITGDIFNFNLKLGKKSIYRIFRTSASTGRTDILATFEGIPAYIHSVFLTENYFILCVWNSHITYYGLSLLWHKNILDAMAPFDATQKPTWYVVDRKHGKGVVATYESDPFFCFHTLNAWEEPSPSDPEKTDIIAELSIFENTDVVHRFYYDNIISSKNDKTWSAGTPKRQSALPMNAQFRLASVNAAPSPTTRLSAEPIFRASKDVSFELATINPSYRTHRHRFSYGTIDRMKSSFMDGIAKFDNVSQKSVIWEIEGHTPGEPIFVADPKGKAEDDGVLLSVVLDGYAERSYLLCLDARTLEEVGRAEVPGPVSIGFHGAFSGNDGSV